MTFVSSCLMCRGNRVKSPPPNLHVEILMPSVMALGGSDGALRVEPS